MVLVSFVDQKTYVSVTAIPYEFPGVPSVTASPPLTDTRWTPPGLLASIQYTRSPLAAIPAGLFALESRTEVPPLALARRISPLT